MTKLQEDIVTLSVLSFFGGVIVTIGITTVTTMENEITRLENGSQRTHFVWNDDEESIPRDGATIRIEDTDGDTIYLGPDPEHDDAQYQFTVTDDSISVQDFDRYVGTVKIEGQLEKLINDDNE
jgi:hypothetical protein